MLSIPSSCFSIFLLFSTVIYVVLLDVLTRCLLYRTLSTSYWHNGDAAPLLKLSLAIGASGDVAMLYPPLPSQHARVEMYRVH